ncbi:CPXM1-like protein [Mya arenaria]|uniref:CPXM1-like protein n=1 Tax=Mya arenaria TaxID=6604 RepID=A0ABY7E6X7_MYAAR|nr:CPXM1-like protein [Mya arenaria]
MHEDPCPGVSKYLQIDYQCVVTLGQPVQMTTTRKQPVTTPNIPVTTATRATPPTTTAAPPQTRAATTQPNLPPGIIPINVGGGGGGNSAGFGVGNSVSKNQTGVTQCHEFLVSGPRGVPDGQLSSSSRLAIANNAHRGRLYTDVDVQRGLEGAWTADPADSNPWIQGRHVNPSTGCCAEWTTGYKVLYSDDGHTWNTVKDANGQDQVFVGNTDTDTPITHIFPCPIVARYIRLQVVSHVGRPSLRLELIGCPTNSPDLGTCPPGWKERPGSATCYFISDQSDTKTWENAMINCRRQQGQMVKIDSAAEKQWLIGELAKLQTTQKLTNFWTGLNNRPRRDNNYYHWHDGTSLNANVVNWRSGEPNNGGGIEHCAEYLTTTDRLNDPGCLKTSDCQALPGITYGDYPSCTGCGFFMTCAPSGAYDRNCPLNLKYDANKDACSRTSSNCAGP